MGDSNFSYLSDSDLIDIILVSHHRYGEDYQQEILNELKNRNIDINKFDNDSSYIQSFINGLPDGWSSEIKNMFDELQASDWNRSMHIQAKEKYGYFHFSGGNLPEKFITIIEKHKRIIDKTCSRCGGKEYVGSNGGDWIEILCRKCAQNDLIPYGIYNISEKGFSFPKIEQSIEANVKGDLTSKTSLFDSGTGVDQYPGAGNHQALFGGTPQSEIMPVSKVGTQYPVPAVQNVIKVTVN